MNKQDTYKLEEFCNFKYGKMPEKSKISEDNSLYPIYSGYKIVGYYEDWNIEKGSLLVVARGVGGTGDVKLSPAKCYLTNLSISIEVDNNIALNEFLYYYWKIKNLRYLDSGSAQSQITINDLKKVEVSLPSIDVQKEIVSILKAFDDKIENNKKINHHLLEQARLLYKNLISSNDTKYQNLSDIARITMGQSPKGETYNDDKIGLPLLNGATDFRNSISPSKWTSDPRKIARPGEYVFGVRATIGLTTKIFKEYAIGRGTGSAKPISNIFDEYLFFALEDLFDYYANLGSGTVYINISKSDFDSFKVILPIKDQFLVDFHKTVQPLFNLIFNNNVEIQKLSELRDCLLPKLLSGEISINQATK